MSVRFFAFLICWLGIVASSSLSAQTPSNRKPLKEIQDVQEPAYAGKPVRGPHKQYRRWLHEQQSHLDNQGRIFNYAKANWDIAQDYRVIGYPAQLQGDWKPIGPFGDKNEGYLEPGGYEGTGGIGRVNGLYFESTNVWYAISAGGGLWRTSSAGLPSAPGEYPWQAVNDDMPVMALSDLVGIPGRSDTLWLLTGDGFGRGIAADGLNLIKPGVGILMSPDSGRTWQTTDVVWDQSSREAGLKLLAVPGDPYTQLAATTNGLYRTTDGWQTSSLLLSGGIFCDLEFEPGNPAVVYAGAFGSLWRSTDTGATWSDISTSVVTMGSWARTGIALSPNNPNRVYLILVNGSNNLNSIQVSNDGGNSFSVVTPPGFNLLGRALDGSTGDGQGNYDLAIWADPNNANRVFVGGINLWESTDGGNNWTIRAEWTNDPPAYVHADIHNFQQAPDSTLIVCSDGGIYASSNGIDWTKRYEGMAITQFYHGYGVRARPDKDISEFGGGAQDNGSLVNELPGPNDDIFTKVSGGDGFRAYRGTPRGKSTRYTSSQNGTLYRQEDNTFSGWGTDIITPNQINSTPDGAWDTPFQPSSRDFNEVTAGYRWLYYTDDADDSGNWTEVQFDQPGGTYNPNGRILEIEWSPSDGNFLYFNFNEGAGGTQADLWACRTWQDGAPSGDINNCGCSTVAFDSIFSYGGSGRAISDISVYPTQPKDVVITRPGYTDGSKVFRCRNTDSLTNPSAWENISFNLPNLPMLCALNDYTGVYVGTDIGAFFLPDGDSIWVYFADGLPTVPVTEFWRHDRPFFGHRLFASTYGRGLWMSTLGQGRRQTRWYVDADATGANSGASWSDAFTNLQTALDAARFTDTIWVAEGIYKPSGENGLAYGTGDLGPRMKSFRSSQAEIHVYGGFVGSEMKQEDRPGDPLAHPTVLSGDIGIPGDSTDNAYHVVVLSGANDGLILDGFYIQDGQADGSLGPQLDGGGIYMSSTSNPNGPDGQPVLSRLIIENNYADSRGGGMFVEALSRNDAFLTLDSIDFVDNRSFTRGGGLAIVADSIFTSNTAGGVDFAMRHCRLANNTANLGGGVYLRANNGATITASISDYQSASNQATDGGGFCIENDNSGRTNVDFYRAHFDADTASNLGGGLCILDGSNGFVPVRLFETVFEDCRADQGGGLGWASINPSMAGLVVDSNSAFLDNRSTLNGGAVYLGGTLGGNSFSSFRDTRFLNNRSGTLGGALAMTGNAVLSDLEGIRLVQNEAGTQGGAIYISFGNDSAKINVQNTVIRENSAETAGGILLNANSNGPGDLYLRNSILSNNVASSNGGGLVSLGNTVQPNRITASLSRIDSNSASAGRGGGMELELSNLRLDRCQFFGNSSSSNGGAISSNNTFHNGGISIQVGQTDFANNLSLEGGGGVSWTSNAPVLLDLRMDSVNFINNRTRAFSNGGGGLSLIGTSAGQAVLNNSRFLDDSARFGGALYVLWTGTANTDLTLEEVRFEQNEASSNGGGIWIRHPKGSHTLRRVDFIDNRANSSFGGGGGLFAYPYFSTGGSWNLDRCWFSGNEAPNGNGGGIHVDQFGAGDTLNVGVLNTVFAGNDARGGAGMFITAAAGNQLLLDWDFVTAFKNTAGTSGGGALNMSFGSGELQIQNSLLWSNTAASGEDQVAMSGGLGGNIDWSLWSGSLPASLVPGINNSSGVPLFVDSVNWIGPDTETATADDGLRPVPGAIGVDAGNPASSISTDLRGATRPAGTAPDLGAYEADPVACVSSAAPQNLSSTLSIGPPPGFTLQWDPIPLSVACNVQGRPLGATSFANLYVSGSVPSTTTVPGSVLVPGVSYEWKVRCACSTSPLVATPFSMLDTFTVPAARESDELPMALFPNPTNREVLWTVQAKQAQPDVAWNLIAPNGSVPRHGRTAWSAGANTKVLPLQGLPPGSYRLQWSAGRESGDLPLVITR